MLARIGVPSKAGFKICKKGMCGLAVILATLPSAAPSAASASGSDVAAFDARHALSEKCQLPAGTATIPDGATATEAEMATAQKSVLTLDAAITAYTDCLRDEYARQTAAHPESAEALQLARAELNNAAIDVSEAQVKAFNAALSKFRNRDLTPPQFLGMAAEAERQDCRPDLQDVPIGNVYVQLKISATGVVEDIQFSQRLDEDMRAAVRCVISNARFAPATRKGVPEGAEFKLTLDAPWIGQGLQTFRKQPVQLSMMSIVMESDDSDIARGLKACRSKDMHQGGHVKLSLTINTHGRVQRSWVARSSGSREVDDVAICVAKWLKYKPGLVDRRLVEMQSVDWEIDIPPQG